MCSTTNEALLLFVNVFALETYFYIVSESLPSFTPIPLTSDALNVTCE